MAIPSSEITPALLYAQNNGAEEESIRFSPAKALNRLLHGEPCEYVFGNVFGWPLDPITTDDISKQNIFNRGGGHKKAIASTLLTAGSGDAVSLVMQYPSGEIYAKDSYGMAMPVTDGVMTHVFLPAIKDVISEVGSVLRENDDAYALLGRTIETMKELLKEPAAVVSVIKEKLYINSTVASQEFPSYFRLLKEVYDRERKGQPLSTASFCKMAIASYAVIGREAAGNTIYLAAHDAKVKPKEDKRYFDAEQFTVKEKPDRTLVVLLRYESQQDIQELYEKLVKESPPAQGLDVITGCPANISVGQVHSESGKPQRYSLLEAMLYRFGNTVAQNARSSTPQ